MKITNLFKSVTRYYVNLIVHKLSLRIMLAIHFIMLSWRRHSIKRRIPGRKVIAIDLTEHFGDIVACEPVSRYVRHQYPDAYILWSVRRPYRELIDNNPYVDETLVVYCLTEWILLPKGKLFDEIIELHINGRVCPICNVRLVHSSGNRDITLENYYDFGSILSTFCQSAGLPALDDQPMVHIPKHVVAAIDSMGLPSNYIVTHCSSNEVDRDWLAAKWHDLVGRLIGDFHLKIVEIGMGSTLKNINPDVISDLCGKLSILETAEVIKRSQLFIGVDSGPAHLANAVKTYGIILIGHYRAFKNYIPYSGDYGAGKNATILYGDGPVADIPVERVFKEVERRLQVVSGKIEGKNENH